MRLFRKVSHNTTIAYDMICGTYGMWPPETNLAFPLKTYIFYVKDHVTSIFGFPPYPHMAGKIPVNLHLLITTGKALVQNGETKAFPPISRYQRDSQ